MRDTQDVDVLTDVQPTRARSALWWSLPTALAVIVVDQLTKAWAIETLAPGPCSEPDACIDLVAGIRFNLVFNTGAAFTRGSGYGPLIGVLAFVMTGVLLFLSTRRRDRFGVILFGALAGGAVGNLLDRIFRADDGPLSGAVIDFIDVGWWPVFNVADMAIVIGVVSIIVHAFLVGEPAKEVDGPDAVDGGEDLEELDGHGTDGGSGDGDGNVVEAAPELGDAAGEAVSGSSNDRPE